MTSNSSHDLTLLLHDWHRGTNAPQVSCDESFIVSPESDPDLIAMDDALNCIPEVDASQAKIVGFCLFGGLT